MSNSKAAPSAERILQLITERDNVLPYARQDQIRYSIEFVFIDPDGDEAHLAQILAATPIPTPAVGERILVHDWPVRVTAVRRAWSREEKGEETPGRGIISSVVAVVPAPDDE